MTILRADQYEKSKAAPKRQLRLKSIFSTWKELGRMTEAASSSGDKTRIDIFCP
ncbi:MAG: hypothetical protein LUQ07_07310 [Methanospirillum sp.]|nr:hypothetical protein [Methanospirillum sp.]